MKGNPVVLVNLIMGRMPCLLMPIPKDLTEEEIKQMSKMVRAQARQKRVEKIKNRE